LLLALMLGACTSTTEEPVETEEEMEETEEATEEVADTFFIPMVQHSSIPYTEQMKVGYEAACDDLPIECEYNAPQTIDIEQEIGMFESMLQKGADAVVLNPASPDAWTQVIKTATDDGVIINTIDNVPEPESGFNV